MITNDLNFELLMFCHLFSILNCSVLFPTKFYVSKYDSSSEIPSHSWDKCAIHFEELKFNRLLKVR